MSASYRYQAMPGLASIEKITPQGHMVQREIISQDLIQVSDHIDDYDTIMCHESDTKCIHYPFTYRSNKVLTSQVLLDLVHSLIPYDTQWTYHNTLIDGIVHNGKGSKYCIGKSGYIQCMLHVILIRSDAYHYFRNKKISRYPQSRSLLSQLQQIRSTGSYHLLYIYDHSLKLLTIQDHIMCEIYTLSVGMSSLKKIYYEQHIDHYFDKQQYDYQLNDFVKEIINKSVNFFVSHIIRRIQDNVALSVQDCYCVCDTSNHFLKEALTTDYMKSTHHNLVYINHIDGLEMYTGHLIDVGLYHTSRIS